MNRERFENTLYAVKGGNSASLVKKAVSDGTPEQLETILKEAEKEQTGAQIKEAVKEIRDKLIPTTPPKPQTPAQHLEKISDLEDENKFKIQRAMVQAFLDRIEGKESLTEQDYKIYVEMQEVCQIDMILDASAGDLTEDALTDTPAVEYAN